ncbi:MULTISPECIES: hypothetical protein [Arthrospira]|nr:hypothetical protein [Arthrospira platensis]AMW27742.1 hypothetical protein AP285_06890 [Arthrospira platensis YZ]KDR58145.1 hypothetical protein APPUASWS_006790 [Arthrospira platensis str. Paraca]MBD2672202.1 hypothetical protein [Arthrospira platensis FACHB-439]MBD2713301.1 hypothetical protein [Arthrospira platensis FACHB-835]MDF2210632.1 hypothetical protein [Arthrospira platensis NCB002]MDT9185819.1 hypothetical protein [Limnospira sp. PMC 289.06]MDT9298095.1 hypothetical protein [Ar
MSLTGGVTFFYNHGFSAREENIKKMEMMTTSEQFNTYQLLLKKERENMRNINQIANQSFNVALGSLLVFLSAHLTKSHADNNEYLDNINIFILSIIIAKCQNSESLVSIRYFHEIKSETCK